MDFRNLTPFDALCYSALDVSGAEHPVIAMKVGYRLVAADAKAGIFHAHLIDDEPPALCTEDRYYGKPGQSSVFEESDLAPYKPRCDVLLRGHAHAPGGQPAPTWPVRLKLSLPIAPETIERAQQAPSCRTLIDKTLHVTGKRHFTRRLGDWWLSKPESAQTVPLRWEHAFGGHSQVANPEHERDPSQPTHLLNEACFSNPVGCGWMERRHDRLAKKTGQLPSTLPAPQIEYPDQPCRRMLQARYPDGEHDAHSMAALAAGYGVTPAGFGPIGRAWAPRLAYAGRYDDHWLQQHWPNPPADFDVAYWNCAPPDQQTEFLLPGARLELWNLTNPAHTPSGYLRVDFPLHRPFAALLHKKTGGGVAVLPLLTDTLMIDTDTMVLYLTYRAAIPADAPVRRAEARFETDPHAPLLNITPRQEKGANGQ